MPVNTEHIAGEYRWGETRIIVRDDGWRGRTPEELEAAERVIVNFLQSLWDENPGVFRKNT